MEKGNLSLLATAVAVAAAAWIFWFGVTAGPANALWTDEGDYTLLARGIAQDGRYWTTADPVGELNWTSRSPGLPYAVANSSYFVGDDIFAGYFTVALFAALGALATFLLARLLFGEIAAIVAVLLLTFTQLFWFYSTRILTDGPQIFIAAAVLYSFFKVAKEGNARWLPVCALFVALGGLFRYNFLAILIGLGAAALLYRKELVATLGADKKSVGISLAAGLAIAVPFMAYQMSVTGSPIGLAQGYLSSVNAFGATQAVDTWFYITNSAWIFTNSFTVLLIVAGMAYSVLRRNREGIALALVVAITIGLLTAVSSWKEDRYAILLYPAAFALAGFVASKLFEVIAATLEGKRKIGISAAFAALCMVFLFSATLGNTDAARGLYENKKPSYEQVEQASAFIATITSPNDWVMANGNTQVGAYARVRASGLPFDYSEFLRRQELYGSKVYLTSFLEAPYELSKVIRAAQAGAPIENHTLTHLLFDTANYRLVRSFSMNITGEDGTVSPQPVVFVFERA